MAANDPRTMYHVAAQFLLTAYRCSRREAFSGRAAEVLAIPAIRLTGLHLALTTFGFGVMLTYVLYTTDLMFGTTGAGRVQ